MCECILVLFRISDADAMQSSVFEGLPVNVSFPENEFRSGCNIFTF